MTRVPDASIVAHIIPTLDCPTPPTRAWWARAFDRTDEEIDALFDVAHAERNQSRSAGGDA